VLYAAKTAWRGVFPERGDHKRRVQEPVRRAPSLVTVKDELAILAQRLVPAIRKPRHGDLPRRTHVALPSMSVTMTTILDMVPTRYPKAVKRVGPRRVSAVSAPS